MLLLYPMVRVDDQYGKDINDVRNVQFIPFQAMATAKFSGTSFLNGTVSGLIEGEFRHHI